MFVKNILAINYFVNILLLNQSTDNYRKHKKYVYTFHSWSKVLVIVTKFINNDKMNLRWYWNLWLTKSSTLRYWELDSVVLIWVTRRNCRKVGQNFPSEFWATICHGQNRRYCRLDQSPAYVHCYTIILSESKLQRFIINRITCYQSIKNGINS